MKGETSDTRSDGFPPCLFSAYCVRLLDDLDEDAISLPDDSLQLEDDAQDVRLLTRLRTHVVQCPTCTAVLVEQRALRAQQRQMLRQVLTEGEREVSSTTSQIMQALGRMPAALPEELARSNGHVLRADIDALPTQVLPIVQRRLPTPRPYAVLRNVLTLVAVLVVIVVSVGMFVLRPSNSLGSAASMQAAHSIASTIVPQSPVARDATAFSPDWSSVVMAQVRNGQKFMITIDPVTGRSVVLASSNYPDTTILDSVSHNGHQLLYHVFDGKSTFYYLQPSENGDALYALAGKGGNAIWSTDDQSIFIGTTRGIEKIDVAKHTSSQVISSVDASDLRFYRSGYLYVVLSEGGGKVSALNRIDVVKGDMLDITSSLCAQSENFWLSPGGAMVYYYCKDQPGLYVANSDGTKARILRKSAGDAIGYAAQGQLLTLAHTQATYQVVRTDELQDVVMSQDIAPGAAQLSASNIAVAPYGQALVALAFYPDGTGKIWYDSLTTKRLPSIVATFDRQTAAQIQFAGWSKFLIPGSSTMPAPVPVALTPTVPAA